jgi:hypothetical protein
VKVSIGVLAVRLAEQQEEAGGLLLQRLLLLLSLE